MAGAGAVGLWLAAHLASVADVTVLARPANVLAVRTHGIRVRGHSDRAATVAAVAEAARAPPVGLAIVTAKAHQTAALASPVASRLREGGALASLQNGFGNGGKLAAAYQGPVATALTSHGLMLEAPGRVLHTGTGMLRVGPHEPHGEAGSGVLLDLLRDAGLAPEPMEDPRPHVWQKALVNHAINPLAAVHRVANGGLLEPPLRERAAALLEEGYALSRAAGIALPGGRSGCEEALWGTLERTRANRCSMLQDVDARRPTEAEQISGRLVRLGRRLGYPMFASEDAYHAVKELEASYLGEEASLRLTKEEVAWEATPF